MGSLRILLLLLSCSAPDAPATTASSTQRVHCLAGPALQIASRYDVHAGQTWMSFRGVSGVETFADFVVDLTVVAADRPAGPGGRDLAPGSCALEDAVLPASMPRRLRWHGAIHPAVGITWSTRGGATSVPIVTTPFDRLGQEGGGRFWADIADGEQAGEVAIRDFGFTPG